MDAYRLQKSKVDGTLLTPVLCCTGDEVSVLCGGVEEKWKCLIKTPKLLLIDSFQSFNSDSERFFCWATAVFNKVRCNLLKESTSDGRLKVCILNVRKYLSGKLFIVNQGLKNRQLKLGERPNVGRYS